MATAPTGELSLPLHYLRLSLADSAAFRTRAGAANQAEALAHIFRDALPPPAAGDQYTLAELQAYRPICLVFVSPQAGFMTSQIGVGGSSFNFASSGKLAAYFEQDVAAEITGDPEEVSLQFLNALGGILSDVLGVAGQAGYLAVTDLQLLLGPMRSNEDEHKTVGNCVWALLAFDWEGRRE